MSDTQLRIGYLNGKPSRLNERVIDEQWITYLSEHVETVGIPPISFIKLFHPSIELWSVDFPNSLTFMADKLVDLCFRHQINVLYVNLPFLVPYLMMARNKANLDLSFLFIAHSVGSEYWLRQWIAIAPWITEKDILLVSSQCSKKALLNISNRFSVAQQIPLCINTQPSSSRAINNEKVVFSIGRIENVKNIDFLIDVFSEVLKEIPDVKLVIAGEYTGPSKSRKLEYQLKIESKMDLQLTNAITFLGPIVGEEKCGHFSNANLLVNFSTDPGETFGFNIIEAKVWGVPTVCTNWNGFRELIKHGEDGFLVGCNWSKDVPIIDKKQAVTYILKILQQNDLREKMSKNARINAFNYDYKQIMPHIIQRIKKANSMVIQNTSHIEDLAKKNLEQLPTIYNLNKLKQTELLGETPLTVLNNTSNFPVNKWMKMVKPCISHFTNISNEDFLIKEQKNCKGNSNGS
jgi:glycosyltransferase involved in cell wall biosynthesis